MNDNKRKLYDALSQDYDLGTFEQFESDIADAGKRRKLYDATIEEYDFGDFSEFENQLGFTPQAQGVPQADTAPQQGFLGKAYAQATRPVADAGADKSAYTFTAEELGLMDKPEKPQGTVWGEESIATVKLPEIKPINVKLSERQLKELRERPEPERNEAVESGSFLTDEHKKAREEFDKGLTPIQRMQMKDGSLSALNAPDIPKNLKYDYDFKKEFGYFPGGTDTEFWNFLKTKTGEEYQMKMFGRPLSDYEIAKLSEDARRLGFWGTVGQGFKGLGYGLKGVELELAEGIADLFGVEHAKENINEERERILTAQDNFKPTAEGVGGFVAEMIPQMAGTGLGLLVSAVNPVAGAAIVNASTAAQVASSMGSTALEARRAGASDAQTAVAMLLSGGAELLSEKYVNSKYIKRIMPKAADVVAEAGDKALESEFNKLLQTARKELGGKFTAKTAKDLVGDMFVEGASEFSAEAVQALIPIVYEHKEDFPNIVEVFNAGLEGFAGGVFMGGIFGGTSSLIQSRANNRRRREQGFVDVANVEIGGKPTFVEVLGKDKDGNFVVLNGDEIVAIKESQIKDRKRFDYNDFRNAEVEYAREIGYEQEPTGENAVKEANEYANARNEVVKVLGLAEDADVDAMLEGRTAEEIAMGDTEIEDAVNYYIKARARRDGFSERYQEERDRQFAESDRSIDETANDGMVYTTTTPSGEKIIITGGKVVLDNEGYIDVNQSEGLVAMFPDGSRKPVRPGDLREKVEVSNAEETKAARRASIEERWRTEFESAENAYVEQQKRAEGIVFDVTDKEGTHRVEVVKEGEEMSSVLVDGEAVQISTEMLNALRGEAGVTQAENGTEGRRLEGLKAKVEGENEVRPEVAPAQTELPKEKQTIAPIPSEKRGKEERAAYHMVPIERTMEDLHDGTLEPDEIVGLIDARIKEAENDVKSVEKKKPVIGADKNAYVAAKQQWQADMEAAKAKVDYYNQLKAINAEVTRSEMREAVEAVKPRDIVEKTADEFVASVMPMITPESFKKETGLKNSEQKALVGVIAGEDNGGVTIEQAAEIVLENYEDELRGLGFNGDVQDVRDMIIDILSTGNPRSYAKKGLEMRQQADVEQQKLELEGIAVGINFKDTKEMIGYEEAVVPRIIQDYTGFDETEYFNNLAENIEYDTTRESEGTRGSSELLQGEQSADNAGVADIAEPGQGGEIQGDVYSGGENAAPQGNQQVSSSEFPNNQIPGLKGYTTDEVLNLTKGHITDILGGDISIVDMRVIGSRSNGTNSEDSDLDVLVEFDGDISEDAFFNAVNGEDALYIDGVRVDINPITKGKSGSIEQWMNRNAGYSKTEGGNALGQSGVAIPQVTNEMQPVQEVQSAEVPYSIALAQYTTKKGKVLDMHLVKFTGELTKEQQRAAKELAKADKGWFDREKGGFMMRTEESAKQLADTILNNEEAVSKAQPVSITDIQALNNGDVLFTEPQQTESGPVWQYSVHVDKDGYTTISRDDVSGGYPIGDARFRHSTNSPEEMLDILRNPLNGMQEVLDAVGVTLENKIKTRELDRKAKEKREQLRANGVNGYKIGDEVVYTPASGTREPILATIHDFEEYGDNRPVLDVGMAPVMYEVAEWNTVSKAEETGNEPKQVNVERLFNALNTKGEAKLSDHVEQQPATTSSGNRLVTDERYAELRERMRKKLGGQMNIGIDPEILAIGTEMAVYHLEKGAHKFTEFAKAMVADLGDAIRPYLKAFYNGARELPEVIENGLSADMTPYDGVQTFDVANFDKPGVDVIATADAVVKEQEVDKQVEIAQERIKKIRNNKKDDKKSVNSQQELLDLFDNGTEGENAAADNSGAQLGREELPDTEQVGAGVPVQDTARNSKRKRRNAGVGSSELGNGPQYDVNRNYTNEEIEEIVSSVTDIVDGKVVITGEVTDDIKAIVRGYESGGIAKKGRGILDEYYTDGKIVDAVNLLIAPYFSGSTPIRVLEPSVGTGNFIQAVNNIPTSEVVAFEINETTARIAKILYPDVDVNLRSFETEFIDESGNKKSMPQKYSLVIGNPPYGSHRGLYKGLGEESKIARYEDYFVKRSLDVLDEGGVLAMVLPSSWMDRHTKFGGYTIERAYRLPSGAFEATQVGTDIVILKKDSSVPVTEHVPYFEQFPERVLGEVKQRKGRYGRLEEYVEGDIDAAIEAIKKENAGQVADLLDIEKNNDALNDIESAVDETGSPEKAVAIVKDAQESEKAASKREQSTSSLDAMPSESGLRNAKADKKPAKKPSGKQDKYKVELNRGVETVPTSVQFTHEFSEGEVEAFADTDYEGALSNPAKHRRYANYIGGQAIHDFYYAEGDIYSKLAQLEQEKDYIVENYGVEQYEKQKALLESVLPKQKSLEEITISPNTTFVKNLNILTEGGRVSLKDMFVDFLRKLPRQAFGNSSSWEVVGYINNEQVHGTDKQRNQLIRERRKRVANDLFNKFLSEELSGNAKKQVVAAFNREYNSTYRPDYSKVPMSSTINRDFKGKPLKLTSVQLAGIGRMTVKGVGVLAHEVGFGKTLSGILAMHEAMTRGFAKKPLIVVPNDNILKQWVETIGEVLPNATINVLGNLGAGYDLTDFKVNDGEFTIITYEGLKAMSFSDGTYNHLASKFSYITEDLNKHQSERDIQKEIEKKNELKGKMKRGTKSSYMFEDFGFDWLTVDEVHNANHIVSKVRLDKSVASDFRSQSQRTSDLGLKTWLAAQYIQEENNGRNVLLLSATPFTNKPLEYYSILSLVGNDMLERKGFFNVDQFFATFMEADNELEIGANGRPTQKTNVRRFRNNGLFQQLLSEFIDIKGEEDNPELVRPERLNKEYKIAQNELTAEAMAAAQELLSDNDTVLQGIGHARAAAFSPYATSLLGMQPKNHKEFVKNSPKIDATIRMIEQNIKDRPDAGQIIYSEVGVEYFPLIRDYLVKENGLKPSEVRIITGATSNNERVNIQTAFNNGEVKVVIGSPAIKEGLNLQGNTTDMYILSLPWNFIQLRQIEGRGWRQGNRWENIRINYMLTNDSVDVFMLQRLQLKQGLYNEAMKSGAESLDVSDIDTAELKTALITDPAVRAEIVTVQERAKLQQEKTQIEADLSFVMRKYEAYNKLVEKLGSQKNTVKMYREWAKKGDEYWAQRAEREEAQLPSLENEIEEEKQNLLKKGVNVDDIVRQTEQAQNAIAAIQEKIDNLKEFQEELTQKFREESEAKAKEQGDLVSTYIKERKAENKGGFYRIRPEKTESKAAEEETEDGVLYRVSDEVVETVKEFNRTHKGAAPTIIIDSIETLEEQLRNAGFSEEDIEESKNDFYDEIAYYHPTYDKIIINRHDVSKEELIGYLWHENAHNAIGKIFTSEETERMFNIIYGPEAPKVKAALAKAGYKPHQQAEEGIVMGIEKCFLDKDALKRIEDGRMKPKEDVDEDAIFAIDYINKTVRFINNGTEQENGNDRAGRDKNNAGEGAPAVGGGQAVEMRNSKEEGESTSTTGGLTEEVNSQEGETLLRKNVTEEEVIEQQEENEESIAKDAVTQLCEALNAPVTIIDDLNSLPENRRNKKGWFDPKTGEVVVVIPNHVSSEDAVQTVLHEVVGHRGLRAVLGEKFDEFLDDVFKNASPKVKHGISDKFFGALRKGHALTVREATEEYIAELAERGFEGYNGVWNSIKQWLKDAFRSLVGFKVTDNELRYLLWKSYNRQKSGPIEAILDIAMEAKTGTGNTMFRVVEDYDKGVQGVWNKAKEGWYDEMRSVKVAQEAIEKELGREVLDSENVYLYANHLPSINKNKKEVFDNKYLKPFTSLLKKLYELEVNGQKMDEKSVERYTNAKHGIERNREMSVKKALTEVQDGKKIFKEEAYAAWAQERDAVRKRKLPWAEEQRELDKVAKKYGAKIRDYSGLTAIFDAEGKKKYAQIADDAYKYVEDVESTGGKDVKELWKLIKGMTDYSLKEAYESGMMSKSTYEHIKQMYRYYVPLRGFTEQTAEDFFDYVEGDHSPLNAVVKTAKGRTSEAENIFATILNMANSAIVQGSKNRLKQRLLNLAMRSRTGLLSVDNAWYAQVGDEYIPVKYPENADEYAAFEERMKELEKNGEVVRHRPGLEIGRKVADKRNQQQHAVRVKRNGREYVVWVNGDPRLANAVNGMLRENFDETWIGALNRWRAQMVTQYSPTFIFTNLVRDVQEASMTYAVRRGTKMMGNFDLNVAANSVKMMSLYLKHKKGALNEEIPVERYFKEFLENGGETGYTEMISIEQYEKQLKKLAEGLNMKNATGRAFEAVGEGLEFANRCIENLCRFSAYQTSREAGMSILKSIEDAKEVSVNFNRKGSGAMGQKWAKALYMFLNPAIQSLAKRILLTKKFPKKMAAVWAGEFVMGATAPLLWSLIRSIFGDDEDKDELMGNYFNLTDYRRRSGLCLPGKDGVFHIPLSHEARALYGLGELFTSYVMGHEKYDNLPIQIFNTLSQSLPLNPLDGWAPGENILESMAYSLTPDAVKPIAEVIMNRDFAGNKVHNRSDFNEFLPEYMRGKRGTADIYKSISKVLSGKEIYGKGVLDNLVGTLINPSTMEHLVEGYLGGAYSFADKAVKTGKWILGNEEYAGFKNVPIGSSFYTSLTKYEDKPREERTRRDWEDAFKFYQQEVKYYDDKETAAKNGEKNGEESGTLVLEQMERNGEVLMVDIFNDGNDRLKELYSASDVARRNREFDKVQEIDKQIYAEKRDIVERMEKLADDPMIGYTFKRNKIKGVYGELETYGDVRDANIINDFQTELQPIQDEYMKVEDWKAYKKLHEKELDMYKDLKRIESDISYEKSKMKENPVYAEEGMTEIRTLRAEAVELINKYRNE